MAAWYCRGEHDASHQAPPCDSYLFIKDLQGTRGVEERKKKLAARQALMQAQSTAEKDARAARARAGHREMYKAYCGLAERQASAVCTNQLLRSLYGKR